MKKVFGNPYVMAAMAAMVLLVAYYFYSRRWRKFSDNGQAGTLSTRNGGHDIGGGLAFIANQPHGLNPGDSVEIEQEPGFKYQEYNGKAIVSHVITDKIFAVNKAFEGNSPANPGRFRKA